MDVVQNAVEARSSQIDLLIAEEDDHLRIAVADNGSGMDQATLDRVQDPFFTDGTKHPGRSVGLGIPFLRQLVDATGGRFHLWSEPGAGTRLEVELPRDHIDLPPTGDLPTVFQQALCFFGDYNMTIRRSVDGTTYQVDRHELAEALGELETVGSQSLLRDYIADQEASLTDTEAEQWQR